MAGTFETEADRVLEMLTAAFEDAFPDADVELSGGVLTIELEDRRTWVINRHGPMRQIWVSSPRAGAWHFAPDGKGNWTDTRQGHDLFKLLVEDVRELAGAELKLA